MRASTCFVLGVVLFAAGCDELPESASSNGVNPLLAQGDAFLALVFDHNVVLGAKCAPLWRGEISDSYKAAQRQVRCAGFAEELATSASAAFGADVSARDVIAPALWVSFQRARSQWAQCRARAYALRQRAAKDAALAAC